MSQIIAATGQGCRPRRESYTQRYWRVETNEQFCVSAAVQIILRAPVSRVDLLYDFSRIYTSSVRNALSKLQGQVTKSLHKMDWIPGRGVAVAVKHCRREECGVWGGISPSSHPPPHPCPFLTWEGSGRGCAISPYFFRFLAQKGEFWCILMADIFAVD